MHVIIEGIEVLIAGFVRLRVALVVDMITLHQTSHSR